MLDSIAPELDKITLYFVFIVPGLIAMSLYRHLMPAKDINWKDAMLEAFFYGSLNLVLMFLPLVIIHQNDFPERNLFVYWLSMMGILILAPLAEVILIKFVTSRRWMFNFIQNPMPTAWDYFFNKRESCFAFIHINTGNMIGGYFGEDSFATSYPNGYSIY